MQTFIGHGSTTPRDETRYLAASGAHILHLLRDTAPDVRAGYYNVPREILESASIGPGDVHCDAYRAWVEDRVRLARTDLDAGRAFFRAAECRRFRLAGLAYIARFEWLIDTLEREEFRLRPAYPDRDGIGRLARTTWEVLASLIGPRRPRGRDRAVLARPAPRR
jgi:phytoene/squalene synthetase